MTDYRKLSAGEFLAEVGTDARKWAEAFMQVSPLIDEATMIAWFANAIEAGRDAAVPQEARDHIAYLLAEVGRLRDALDRLASNEAFITPRVATEEETARMQYAEQARDGIL